MIKNPQPVGQWRIETRSTSAHSVRVTGVSKLDFVARFTTNPATRFDDANYQPMQDIVTHALLQPAGMDFDHGVIESFILLDIRGVEIGRYSLSVIDDSLLLAEPFRPPNVSEYYMLIKGTMSGGEDFIRQSHNAIINLIPEPPTVKMLPSQPGYLHTKATLVCSVQSMTPFTVVWYFGDSKTGDNWQQLTNPQLLAGRANADARYIVDVTDQSEGYYKCVVETTHGSDQGVLFLDVEEQPPQIEAPEELTVPPGETAYLFCNVTSKIKYDLEWKRRGATTVNSPRISQKPDGTLIIESCLGLASTYLIYMHC